MGDGVQMLVKLKVCMYFMAVVSFAAAVVFDEAFLRQMLARCSTQVTSGLYSATSANSKKSLTLSHFGLFQQLPLAVIIAVGALKQTAATYSINRELKRKRYSAIILSCSTPSSTM